MTVPETRPARGPRAGQVSATPAEPAAGPARPTDALRAVLAGRGTEDVCPETNGSRAAGRPCSNALSLCVGESGQSVARALRSTSDPVVSSWGLRHDPRFSPSVVKLSPFDATCTPRPPRDGGVPLPEATHGKLIMAQASPARVGVACPNSVPLFSRR